MAEPLLHQIVSCGAHNVTNSNFHQVDFRVAEPQMEMATILDCRYEKSEIHERVAWMEIG